ncbi:hypothetical protein BCR32DRAFT_289316 [Anaeromyces robustus]|uniref:Uncharacterized protein n=1 Tax=Anaeromyces robustus TaxID=1754192 RepID=A0A1Y1XQA0_9FUNG|nr:hypothetical protein BCR32DRAFT_289316 [Anaeromyces robustus]|eukprot:ORX87494.1 hypothetical protein BCR32DRAFT_289316 [Anaeromyces robustus]
MSKRERIEDNENGQVKKFFATNTQYNLNPQSNKKFENQMDICYDSNPEDNEMSDINNTTTKVVLVKESHSSEILNMDFYPNLHRHITNKIGW